MIAFALLAAAAAAAAPQDLAALTRTVEAFAQAPARIDPRLRLAACPAPSLEWAGAARTSVAVRCAAPAWTVFIAVAAPPPAPPLVRRGDAVTVTAGGDGFAVTLDGIAEGDGRAGGTVRVRTASGARMLARVEDDGSLRPALSARPIGR